MNIVFYINGENDIDYIGFCLPIYRNYLNTGYRECWLIFIIVLLHLSTSGRCLRVHVSSLFYMHDFFLLHTFMVSGHVVPATAQVLRATCCVGGGEM